MIIGVFAGGRGLVHADLAVGMQRHLPGAGRDEDRKVHR